MTGRRDDTRPDSSGPTDGGPTDGSGRPDASAYPGGDGHFDGHFDELEAVRRFPSEQQWLDLPLPSAADPDDRHVLGDAPTFADRVLQHKHADEQLDRDLAELDAALPAGWWQQFEFPAPSADFVAATLAAVQDDRRQRWQAMLARYVAPEPSSAFVSRTLAALNTVEADVAGAANSNANGDAASGMVVDSEARRSNSTRWGSQLVSQLGSQRSWWGRRNRTGARGPRSAASPTRLVLVAAAAAAAVWWLLAPTEHAPLELRLALRAPPAVAYADATSPLAAVLARVADDDEPFAVFDAPADGLWLVKNSGGPR